MRNHGGSPRAGQTLISFVVQRATTWNPDASARVWALAVSGSTIYAGGYFSCIGGVARECIAALDASTGHATSWDPDANGPVYAFAVSDQYIYVGGDFSYIGGKDCSRLARFDLETLPTPTISSISPTSGKKDTTVTINGENFGDSQGSSYVKFGSVKATSYPSWSNTQIRVKVPGGSGGKVNLTVTTSGGTSSAKSFSILPSISTVSLTSGKKDTTVTISGSAFGTSRGSSYVKFGSVKATSYPSWSNTQIKVKVPSISPGKVKVTATTSGGTSNYKYFTVLN